MGGSVGGISNTNIHITPSNEMMGERPLPKLLGNIFEILHGYDGGDGRAIHQHPVTPWVLIMTVSPKQEVWNPLSPRVPIPLDSHNLPQAAFHNAL